MQLLGFVSFLVALILTARITRIVYPVRIANEHARLEGFGRAFLDSIPLKASE